MKKFLSRMFFTITTLLIFSSAVYSEEWCFVASSKNHYFFVDSDSINIGGKDVTCWILMQHIETGKVIFKKRITLNCEDETIIVRDIKRFSLIDSFLDAILSEENFKWHDILPNSKMQVIERMLCADGEPIKNVKERLKKPFSRHR